MRRRHATNDEIGAAPGSSALKSRIMHSLARVDFYTKLQEEVKVKTEGGGVLTIFTLVVVFILVVSELSAYMDPVKNESIGVDTEMSARLSIQFNISYFALSCASIELVVMDVAGEHQLNLESLVHKHRIDRESGHHFGEKIRTDVNKITKDNDTEIPEYLKEDYCGSCYGAKEGCCNTCLDILEAYENKGWDYSKTRDTFVQCIREKEHPELAVQTHEGCTLEGQVFVNKVAGNFHVALGKSRSVDGRLIHQFVPSQVGHFNTSHRINHLSFGQYFPGQQNPLDGVSRIVDPHESSTAAFQYFIKVIPSQYKHIGFGGRETSYHTSQYTFTKKETPIGEAVIKDNKEDKEDGLSHKHSNNLAPIQGLPGTFFVYEISPFVVRRTDRTVPFTEFLTGLCAIIGGIYTISGILDSAIFHSSKALKTRSKINKRSN